jgi:ubiquinone/menaquinone biosynthesis C-methylase UbiE
VKSKKYLLNFVEKQKSVLDIGCGNGDFAIACGKKASKVIGLDVSKNMIKNAKKNAAKNNLKNVKFSNHDFFSFESDEQFDFVSLVYFLNVFPDEESVELVLNKAKLHLKPGGYILIADELEPINAILHHLVRSLRIPIFLFFYLTTGLKYHKIHDLKKILERLNINIIEEKRFLFQYCSVLIGKV